MVWQVNGTPDTLGGNADSLNITDLTPVLFNLFLNHALTANTGNVQFALRIGTGSVDTGFNYANRNSQNGGVDGIAANQSTMSVGANLEGNTDKFGIQYVVNIAGEEKVLIGTVVGSGLSGSGTPPNRGLVISKWVTGTQIDQVQLLNAEAGDYAILSNLSAFGTD